MFDVKAKLENNQLHIYTEAEARLWKIHPNRIAWPDDRTVGIILVYQSQKGPDYALSANASDRLQAALALAEGRMREGYVGYMKDPKTFIGQATIEEIVEYLKGREPKVGNWDWGPYYWIPWPLRPNDDEAPF